MHSRTCWEGRSILKKELKVVIPAASFQNTIFYLELESQQEKKKREGEEGGKKLSQVNCIAHIYIFQPNITHRPPVVIFLQVCRFSSDSGTSCCKHKHCSPATTNLSVLNFFRQERKHQQLLRQFISRDGMEPSCQSVRGESVRCAKSCRDKLIHHLCKNMLRGKDVIRLNMEKFGFNSSQQPLTSTEFQNHCQGLIAG